MHIVHRLSLLKMRHFGDRICFCLEGGGEELGKMFGEKCGCATVFDPSERVIMSYWIRLSNKRRRQTVFKHYSMSLFV